MSFNECSVLINLDPMLSNQNNFFEFVYKKIAKDQKNRFVERGEGYIDILPFDTAGVRVIPSFKEIDSGKLQSLNNEVSQASQAILIEDDIAQLYIAVY